MNSMSLLVLYIFAPKSAVQHKCLQYSAERSRMVLLVLSQRLYYVDNLIYQIALAYFSVCICTS